MRHQVQQFLNSRSPKNFACWQPISGTRPGWHHGKSVSISKARTAEIAGEKKVSSAGLSSSRCRRCKPLCGQSNLIHFIADAQLIDHLYAVNDAAKDRVVHI